MDRHGLYKSRPVPGKGRDNRTREHQTRGHAKRSEVYLQNRGLSADSDTETPATSPAVPAQEKKVMKSVNKMAGTMNFTTQAEERMFKLTQIRKRIAKRSPKKRSPFVTAVPTGRIVPKKRDPLEEKMKEYRERHAMVENSRKRRSVGGKTAKRKSIGKTQLVVRKQANNKKAVVVKPVTRPKSVKKENKSMISVPKIIIDPQPGPSGLTGIMSGPRSGKLTFKPPTPRPNLFMAPPALKVAPKSKKKENRASFNICNSFVTSTTSKRASNAKIIPPEEKAVEDSFLEGFSPIPDATPFKFTAKKETSSNSSKGLPVPMIPDEVMEDVTKVMSPVNDEPFVFVEKRKTNSTEKAKEPTIDDELNITFTQDDEDVEEGALVLEEEEEAEEVVKDEKKRRSSIRKSLPVIPSPEEREEETVQEETKRRSSRKSLSVIISPEKSERTSIAKSHYDTLESEIKRLTDRNTKWTNIKEENLLDENIIGLINSGIGQSELLMRKKFPKFKELIENYENNSGERAVLADDLDGYWYTVNMEIENIDKRFTDLEACQANNWEEKVEEEVRPKTRAKRGRKKASEKKGTVSDALKEHLRKIRENMKANKEIPELDAATNVQLIHVKRLAETPRKSIAKRRSLNCSGCIHTPSSSRKSRSTRKPSTLASSKNASSKITPVSTHSMVLRSVRPRRILFDNSVTETPKSTVKSGRKSSKKINLTESQVDEVSETVESVAHRSILKSSNKRNTKSVLFVDESPAKSEKRRQGTPRRKNTFFNQSIDYQDENSPMSTYNTPLDASNVTMSRGRKSRKSTPKPKIMLPVSDTEDSPLCALPESQKRRSTRLFGNLTGLD